MTREATRPAAGGTKDIASTCARSTGTSSCGWARSGHQGRLHGTGTRRRCPGGGRARPRHGLVRDRWREWVCRDHGRGSNDVLMSTNKEDVQVLLRALAFAAHKHRDQRRKDADASPYINHPIALAACLANEGGVTEITVLVAALLHDTVEDIETTVAELGELAPPVQSSPPPITRLVQPRAAAAPPSCRRR